ncbi:hypothetical protein ELUCI_v1c08320 [Williamsoniiplasma lucivorax]|uniref:Uncharacterized protein n=1 Tax=Williamsoniiplasma lucivorax TaxID=209274 RepID=A0A2S5RAF1_9MOLU|nr:hypothetical protein ELUCI_v1c08320 [Williamsoniiplasma lucivorax]
MRLGVNNTKRHVSEVIEQVIEHKINKPWSSEIFIM